MTSPRFLLDTNIFSEATKPQPSLAVMAKLKQYTRSLATASVVFHELTFGCYRLPASKRRQELEKYIDSLLAQAISVFPYDLTAAQWHASERSRLVNLGRTPSYFDGQIAAIAAVNDLVLVTRNVVDYADFENLEIQNWFEV